MQQVVTKSSVLTVSELREHSGKMWKLYDEIDSAQKSLDKFGQPKLGQIIEEPRVSYEWAKKVAKRRKKREITAFVLLNLLIFGVIFALYFSDLPYINSNNIIAAFLFACTVFIIHLIVCISKCVGASCDPSKILRKERKKQRARNKAYESKNKRILEENDRIKSEWEQQTASLRHKLNTLKKQAAQYSELYAIWNNCANDIRQEYYAFDWEWNLPDKNLTMINHILSAPLLILEFRVKQPMRVLEMVCMAKEIYTSGCKEAHEKLKRQGTI